jgi:hypothetical protein
MFHVRLCLTPQGRRIGLGNQPTITLHYVRKDGERERTELDHHTISQARELAKWVLHVENGFYTEVDICNADGTIERIQNPAVLEVGAI